MGRAAIAQVNVLTAHNDIARTGQNLQETVLTPSNVNPTQFGQLFSHSVYGGILAQPLYVSNVTIRGALHNVVYVATNLDFVYAFDAENNGGINAGPLWSLYLPGNTYFSDGGVIGTPVIDPASDTMYLVSHETLNSTSLFRLHALDITTGAEKFGGPLVIQGSVPGTGSGSSGGTLTLSSGYQWQRSGLLLLNGILYIAFSANADNAAWHGWLFSYKANTLKPIDALCLSPNGSGAGVWMGGSGLAAEVSNPAKPFGRMFFATGNGSFSATSPYTRSMSYGMSVLDLDLTQGIFTVEDSFTPYNEATLEAQDADFGSGGPVLLPAQTLSAGNTLTPLIQAGKSGTIYILNRNNLGGFNAASDHAVQEVTTRGATALNWGQGVWGTEAYWNKNIYYGGTLPGSSSTLAAYSFNNGELSTSPTSTTSFEFPYPGPTPSISANSKENAILWAIGHGADSVGSSVLLAYDATNLANLLYSSNANLSRDDPGPYVEFTVPTIANGKVYVGSGGQFSAYGLLGAVPTVAPPVISPPGATFTGSQTVTITDATPGAAIYYTTDGSTPTYGSKQYSNTTAITVTASETITAIASATGYLQGEPVSAVFSSTANAANPVFLLAGGTYSGMQTLGITDATTGAQIYYTVDGSTPSATSIPYTQPITIPVSETVQAIAIAPSLLPSSIVSAAYVIDPAYTIDFSQGFAQSQASGQMKFNGSTDLDDFRLQLTNGGYFEAGSAFYSTPVPISAFTTDFTFQLSNPVADGITFTIQGVGPTALGLDDEYLGYGGINNSVAIKFDINNNAGEGNDSTGMYLNGAIPTVPAILLNNTGINLLSGDQMNVHITYDGQNLNMTITDAITLTSWSNSWVVNIPAQIGGSTGYVGFTGSTGGATASQKLTYWTYLVGNPLFPNYPAGFDPVNAPNILALNGSSTLSGTGVLLTSGSPNQAASAYYATPVDINAFTTDFDFTIESGTNSVLGEGMTFVIQNASPTAIGGGGGGLGYATMPNSVAIKFDFHNDAGEGSDSTGVYTNGAMPTLPESDLTPSGLQLTSGHQYHVHVIYDGTTLTWATHDLTHGNNIIEHLAINIPQTIGSNIAYIGFTGSTGASTTANQAVLDWTFTNP